VLSVDAFVFSVDDVFSYRVVDLLGMSPAVLFTLDVVSNLFAVVRGFAGEDAEADLKELSIFFFL
jgi:hypothetical protein